MTVANLPGPPRPVPEADRPTCILCRGPLVAVPMLGSMGCANCGSTFTLDGLAAHQRRASADAASPLSDVPANERRYWLEGPFA